MSYGFPSFGKHYGYGEALAGGSFNPADTNPDLWYDLSDGSTVWQDTGATTPGVSGSPIALVQNKGSLVGGDPEQVTASRQPDYLISGGVSATQSPDTSNWLSDDGSGPITDVSEFWLSAAFSVQSATGSVIALDGANFQYIRIEADQIFVRAEASSTNEVTIPYVFSPTMQVVLLRFRESDRTVTLFRNGVQEGQVVVLGTDWFPSAAPARFHAADQVGNLPTASTIAEVFLHLRALDAQEQLDLTAYLMSKGDI